jgi:pSer/pThr/pTyr-binding forkhead associated (FHA) protein
MTELVQLVALKGPQAGKTFPVTANGVRIGRTSKNDIVLDDSQVSRFHCRIYTKDDGTVWVTDLGSSNQTLLNEKPVQESRLSNGDRVTVGGSVIRVQIGTQPPAAPLAASEAAAAIDLGLASDRTPKAAGPVVSRTSLIILGVLLLVLAGGIALLALRPRHAAPQAPAAPPPKTLEIEYEKVQASTGSIFRYSLHITPDRKIIAEIDNTERTHVREEGVVKEDLLQELSTFIQESGFFALADEYTGEGVPNVLERTEIAIVIGRKTQRIRVANRVEPPAFKSVRERLEEFGKVELNIWDLQYSSEKLLAMARDAYLLARKMYEEREVAYGNLAQAAKSYKDAEFCLRTVEPKPDYYPEILSARSICDEEMEKRYNNQNFLATRAINLKSWEDAASELRVIMEMIPDAADPRHETARLKLLEVENRMKKRK